MAVGLGFSVAFDVTARIAGTTGVARYAAELDRALGERGVIVRRYAIGRAIVAPPPGTRRIPIPLRVAHRVWALAGGPAIDRFAPHADVIHTADLVAPPTRRPSVATVHDLEALDRPDLHPDRAVAQQRAQLGSLDRVAVVIADSEATAHALVRHRVDPDRICVAPLGVTPLPPAHPARLTGADRYVLCVGSLALRKGQDILIGAWGRLRPSGVALVLAGPDGHGSDAVRAALSAQRGGVDIRLEGQVSDERLAALYRGAAVVCVPSRAEGFGLPVIEALAASVPVVATDLEAIREVAAGAAVLVRPDDEDALAAALEDALRGGPDEPDRVARGVERASSFTWGACADATMLAYARALA